MMALYKTGIVEQKEIGELLHLEKSSLSRNLVRLINSKYIVKNGPSNRPMIELTENGIAKVDMLTSAWKNSMDEIYKVLSAEDIKAFEQFEAGIAKI